MRKPPSHSMYGNKKCIAAKIFHPSMASKKVSFLLKREANLALESKIDCQL